MIETDLFEFAYVPDWYGQLEQLAEMFARAIKAPVNVS